MSETNKVYTQELYNQNERTTEDGYGANAYWQLNWEYTKEAPGETRVSWWLTKGGRSSSPTWLHTAMKLTFFTCTDNSTSSSYMTGKGLSNDIGEITGGTYYDSANKRIYYDSGRISTSDASARPNCRFNNSQKDVKMVEGSFIIKHDINGRASFSVKCQSWVYYGATRNGYPINGWYESSRQKTNALFVLPTNMPYKICPKPTSLGIIQLGNSIINGTVLPKSGNLINSEANTNLFFSAGYDDTGLTDLQKTHITGFQVYGKVGANPTLDNYDFTYLIGLNGTEINLLESSITNGSSLNSLLITNRGKNIHFVAITKSKGGTAFDSPLSDYYITKIKQLPVANFASVNSVFPSGNTTASFTITSISGLDAQTSVKVEYINLTDKTTGNQNINLPITAPVPIDNLGFGQYQVRISDGYENGSYTQVILTRNKKPQVAVNIVDIDLNSAYKDSAYPYYLHPTVSVNFSDGQTYNNRVNIVRNYWYINENNARQDIATVRDSVIINNINTTFTFQLDPRPEVVEYNLEALKKHNIFYDIQVTRNDSIENSTTFTSPTYQITHYPRFEGFYNHKNGNNWIQLEDFETSFSNRYLLKFAYDAGYLGTLMTTFNKLTASSQLYQYSNNLMYAEFSFNNVTERGTTANLSYSCSDNTGIIFSGILPKQITRILHPLFNNVIGDWDPQLEIFDKGEKGTNSVSCKHPFLKELALYGLSDLSGWMVQCNGQQIDTITAEKYGDTLNFAFSNDALYNSVVPGSGWPVGLGYYTLSFIKTNMFNEAYSFALPITINFNTGVDSIGNQTILFNGSDTWDYLLEEMSITFSDGDQPITSYNKDVYGQLYMTYSVNNSSVTSLISSSFKLTPAADKTPRPGVPVNFSLPTTLPNLPRFTGDFSNVEFGIKFSVVDTEATWTNEKKFNVVKTEPGVFILESGKFENSTATINYSIKNYGSAEETPVITARAYTDLQQSPYDIVLVQNGETDTKTGTFVPEFNGKDYTSVYVKFTTSFTTTTIDGSNESYKKTYTVTTNQITIYNTTPTVSYRKNKIGINKQDLADYTDAILVVGQHDAKNKICLVSLNNGEEITRYINLETGELTNFTIDGNLTTILNLPILNGGSWDGTVPTGPAVAEETQF